MQDQELDFDDPCGHPFQLRIFWDSREDRARLFSEVPSKNLRGRGLKLH